MSIRPQLVWLAAIVALGCAQPSSKAPQPPANAHATHGGAAARLGSLSMEVVVHASGELHAHLLGGRKPTGLALTATVPDAEGNGHAVAMRFADGVQGFVGQMEATPAPGTVELLLVDEGRPIRGRAEVAHLVPAPRHGGSVVAVGAQTVEVVVDGSGEVVAYPRGDVAGARLTVVVPGDDGASHPVALEQDDDRFRGHIEGLTPRPGPLEVLVEREARVDRGRGTLASVGESPPEELPSDLRLELPALGSHLPAVIAVPPEEGDGSAARGEEDD